MKAITEYTEAEYARMIEKCNHLHDCIKGVPRNELITVETKRGYAHYTFHGSYTDKLVERLGKIPDAEELIMLVDNGFSHFGASIYVDHGHKIFSGRVNID